VGGIVGGVLGTVKQLPARPRAMPADSPFPFRRDEFEDEGPVLSAGALYWLLVSFLVGAVSAWYFGREYLDRGTADPNDLLTGALIAFLVLPALQLGASALAAVGIALFYPQRAVPLERLVKITLWSFAGAVVGTLVMLIGCLGVMLLFK
jgi:hypothetical protein